MKRNLRKIIGLVLVLALSLAVSVPTFAQVKTNNDKPTNKSGTIEVGDSKTVISEVLTFDEIVEAIAADNQISKAQAADQVISSFAKQDLKRSSVAAKTISAKAAATRAQYRTISAYLTVTSEYEPTLRFYCETSEGGGSFHGIVKILNVSMNREYKGLIKQFGGTVYANLEDPNIIFYIVDGDFYNTGTTTGGGGVNIGVGESASINFNLSHSSNYYAYCHIEQHCNW